MKRRCSAPEPAQSLNWKADDPIDPLAPTTMGAGRCWANECTALNVGARNRWISLEYSSSSSLGKLEAGPMGTIAWARSCGGAWKKIFSGVNKPWTRR